MSYEERVLWEQKIGFKSMRTCIIEVYERLEQCSSIEELNHLVDNNSDIIMLKEDEITQILPTIFHTIYINRDGLYYIGNVLCKITPSQKIVVWSGDIEKLNNLETKIKTTNYEKISSDDIIDTTEISVFDYIKNSNLKSFRQYTGTVLVGQKTYNRRRCKLTFISWLEEQYNSTFDRKQRYVYEYRVDNYKKNFWGNYVSYATTTTYEQIMMFVYLPVKNGSEIYTLPDGRSVVIDSYYMSWGFYGPYTGSSNGEVYGIWQKIYFGEYINNNPLPLPEIWGGTGRATNRGIGTNWAGICYGDLMYLDCVDF